MFRAFPPTRRQLIGTAAGAVVGITLMAVGAYLSFENIEPQQIRAKQRSDFIKQRLRQLLDD